MEKQAGGGIAIDHHPQDSRTELSKDGICQTLTGKMGTGGGNVPLILDDQGGWRITANDRGIAPTLRAQVHGHPPITMQIRSGCEGGGKGPLLQVEKSATLTGSQIQTLFEPIALDLYNQEAGEVVQTLRSGHGGDTVPCAAQPRLTPWDVQSRRIHSENGKWPSLYGGEGGGHGYVMTVAKEVIPINDKATRYKGGGETRNEDGAGNGLGIGEVDAPAYTLTAMDRHAVAYCLDKAAYNQGENALYGIGVTEDVTHTITAGWQPPAVAYDCRNDAVNLELSGTLQAKDNGGQSLNYTNPVAVPEIAGTLTAKMAKGTGGPAGDECQNLVAWYPEYIVRRLMPVECGRLQGFPDGWTEGLAYTEPDEQTVDYWESVFEEHRRVTGEPKNRRKRSQIVKWLKNPYSDTALYKMWGNGIALPCAAFVMKGIVMELQGGGTIDE